MTEKTVLVVGSGLSDVYVNLDPRLNPFEFDEAGTPWLDLQFDERDYPYFQQTPVLGGAAVTLEALQQLGCTATLASGELAWRDGRVQKQRDAKLPTRFILCRNQRVAYLSPRERRVSVWRAPSVPVDWVLVDRSAELDKALVAQIQRFLGLANHTQLAVHLRPSAGPLAYQLAQMAQLVFVEDAVTAKKLPRQVAKLQIRPDRLCYFAADSEASTPPVTAEIATASPQGPAATETATPQCVHLDWQLDKAGFVTHLTTYSVAAATFLASRLQEEPVETALLKARLNAERTRLDGSLSQSELTQAITEIEEEKVNVREIAACMVAPGKGILAADESGGSTAKHFAEFDIPDDVQHRRDYRNLLLSLPDLPDYINAVILFDETTRQLADNGQNFVDFLTGKGIIPGVKVDQGLENFPNSSEQFTKGLEGLPERMRAYFQQGLRFAKWRSLFVIDPDQQTPSDWAITKVCADLAEYARICQAAGIVPIVEPEVLHDGNHTIETAAATQRRVLKELFRQLERANVDLPGVILKCSMVLAGGAAEHQSTPEEVGAATGEVLRECVPAEVAGVVFLSGGQGVERATENLRAVEACGPYPWPVTFSFARALQWPALETWRGDNANIAAAQEVYRQRLVANCQALKTAEK